MKGEIKLIGDYLGTIEEFVPGEGTYAEDGKIYASNIGIAIPDQKNHTVRVDGKIPPELKVGNIVFGDVLGVKKNIVTVIVRKIMGFEGFLDIKTGIYVSNIADSYVDSAESMFGVGDIVKGKVIKIEDSLIDLSTKGDDLGVVKGFCKRCRFPLVKSEKYRGKMECLSCGHREDRKISLDYGNVAKI